MMLDLSRGVNWGPVLFLLIYQALLLICLPIYFYYASPSWGMWLSTIVLLYASGISITMGYHRYYAHRTYKTNRFLETILLFFGSMAVQGSALRWAYDHRLHHAYVDTDRDPYSIKKGFWYAHFLWLFEVQHPIEDKVVPDLLKNPLVMFQHRFGVSSMVVANSLAFVFIGWLLGDYLGAFFLSLWLRMLLLHHFTWFINSLAHTWGDKPFCVEQSAVDNYFISLLTFGEGYHNYHHTYASDYRNGVKWYHFDPAKWILWVLHKCHVVRDLRKMDKTQIEKRMVLERERMLLDKIKELWFVKKEELELRVKALSEEMREKISRLNEYSQLPKELRREQVAKFRELKRSLHDDLKRWRRLSKDIMGLHVSFA